MYDMEFFSSKGKLMWYRVYADGSEIDIVHAYSPEEAIKIVKMRQDCIDDTTTIWKTRTY